MNDENTNKGGKIVLLIFLLICSGLGIAAFTMSLTSKCDSSISTRLNCSDCKQGSGDCIYSGNDKKYDGQCYPSKRGVCPGGYVKCL